MKKTPEDDVIALAANIMSLEARLAEKLDTEFVGPKEAAFYLGMTVQGVHDKIKRETLRAVNVDGRWHIHRARLPSKPRL